MQDMNKRHNNEYIIIGITGRKRSGKDTIGKYLIDNYNFVKSSIFC